MARAGCILCTGGLSMATVAACARMSTPRREEGPCGPSSAGSPLLVACLRLPGDHFEALRSTQLMPSRTGIGHSLLLLCLWGCVSLGLAAQETWSSVTTGLFTGVSLQRKREVTAGSQTLSDSTGASHKFLREARLLRNSAIDRKFLVGGAERERTKAGCLGRPCPLLELASQGQLLGATSQQGSRPTGCHRARCLQPLLLGISQREPLFS